MGSQMKNFNLTVHYYLKTIRCHKPYLKIILVLLVCLILHSCVSQNCARKTIRVLTFNIRVNVESDSLNAWPFRKDIAASMIRFHHADIVGVQEALIDQVRDLAERLPQYNWLGVGRDDGREAGEFMVIYYLEERFRVLKHGTFWLSEHPDIPGLGWDAACNRIVTWSQFVDGTSGKTFYLFNTHFDHVGKIARAESARLLLKYIKEIAGNPHVIVTGDFNTTPNALPYQYRLDLQRVYTTWSGCAFHHHPRGGGRAI